ncbi:MAG: DUF934 domain-containing protein [Nannocystaceae bacterium]|nr:DUF934 domain-containing protein [Nannocystaceae bacterium]
MEIIRDQKIVQDSWRHIEDGDPVPESGDVTVSLIRFGAERSDLDARSGRDGVRVGPDEEIDTIIADLGKLPLIAVTFPKFTDGRGYSTARLLRGRHGYTGELRATGQIFRDQLFYLHRVGFDAFEMAPGKSLSDALEGFSDFSVTYQSSSR